MGYIDNMKEEDSFHEMAAFMRGMEKKGLPSPAPKGGIFVEYITLDGKCENYAILVSSNYPKSLEEKRGKEKLEFLMAKEPEEANVLKKKLKEGYKEGYHFLTNFYMRAVVSLVESVKEIKEPPPGDAVVSFSSPEGDVIYEALRNIHRTLGKSVDMPHGWCLLIIEEMDKEKDNFHCIRRFIPDIYLVEDYTQLSSDVVQTLTPFPISPNLIQQSVVSSKEKMDGVNGFTTKILLNCLGSGMVEVIVDNSNVTLEDLKDNTTMTTVCSSMSETMKFFRWFLTKRLASPVEDHKERPVPVKIIWEICKSVYPDHSFMIDHCNVAIPTMDGFMFTYVPVGNETLN